MSANASFNPNIAWGGVWQKIEGKFLFGSSNSYTIGLTGGSSTVKLEFENYQYANWSPSAPSPMDLDRTFPGNTGGLGIRCAYKNNNNTPFSIMPPYETVNIWKRTA